MKFSDWLSKTEAINTGFNIGISDIGSDAHDQIPPMDSPGAFQTIGDDKPPTNKVLRPKCKCCKKRQFGINT
jgi:hypothetical protein